MTGQLRRMLTALVLAAVIVPVSGLPVRAQALRPMVGADRVHEVREGETLYSIAHQYGLSLEHVAWVNRLPMQLELSVGRKLLIPLRRVLPAHPPRDGMVLNVPERTLYLFRRGHLVKHYPVAVGRPGFPTPRGDYRVISKVKNPTWLPPAWAGLGEVAILPGPKNPLGDRWIGLSAIRVGIHGTQSPYSIGMAISHGCIRMYPDQVHDLYERVWIGMPIRLEYDTVKFGRDPRTGQVYVASFPDVYRIARPQEQALRLARQGGFLGRVSPAALRRIVARADGDAAPADGRPHPLAALLEQAPAIGVEVDRRPLPLAAPPIANGAALWVPVEVVKAAGLSVTPPRDDALLQVRLDADPLEFYLRSGSPPAYDQSPADPEHYHPLIAWSWKGRIYLPARALFETFGIRCEWKPGDRVVRLVTVEGD